SDRVDGGILAAIDVELRGRRMDSNRRLRCLGVLCWGRGGRILIESQRR
ncbi:hypothetical protein A2U01_0088605, partial [Trifolium medium]|nr:hypothetical protein [Trifolium medium]